jgi:oligopeptide/dipeptide ABC transporter ATP-binding protein
MYLGQIMEIADRDAIYDGPMHPYTQALESAVPVPDPAREAQRHRIILEGDVPSPLNPPAACRFHTRCWKAQQICREEEPALVSRAGATPDHLTACHFAEAQSVV